MSVFAAVDIGSNSVRLKIARVVGHRLQAIHEDRAVTRLGETVFRSGILAPEAMDTTVKVLRRFHHAVQDARADRVRVVATSALRDARNSPAFAAWVLSATGWKVETISGLEEGRLIHLGVMANSRLSSTKVLLIDLGGGSCELTVSDNGHIREMVSLPLGAVRLTEEFLRHDPPTAVEVHRLLVNIGDEIDRVSKRIVAAKVKWAVATSGTAAALAGAARVVDSERRGLKGKPISRQAVAQLAEHLAGLDVKARLKVPGIGPRRAEIIVAGACVYAELMERCKLGSFRYSPLGLRDGLLAQMLAEHDSVTGPRRQIEAERADAILALCKQYRVDLKAAEGVRRLALQLFRELARVHTLPAEYEGWLSAAAMLNDVGMFISRNGRHRHTYYLIANSEILGFTPDQRKVIAAIARYLGKSRPHPDDPPMKALSGADEERVPRAVVLLRLAKAMNHGPEGNISRVSAELDSQQVVLKLTARKSADLEMWLLQK
ncbi:MAG: Ppx/GppA family phosphatase, partial [Acidobacteria bacterium]|nr:Ppx/GppA family phosphatase [Acidobacteriota bacterium]